MSSARAYRHFRFDYDDRLINLDFADVKTIMSDQGEAIMGIGVGSGENRAVEAVDGAIHSALLETSIDGAQSILLNVTGGPDISLYEINEAAEKVAEAVDPEATSSLVPSLIRIWKIPSASLSWLRVLAKNRLRFPHLARALVQQPKPAIRKTMPAA